MMQAGETRAPQKDIGHSQARPQNHWDTDRPLRHAKTYHNRVRLPETANASGAATSDQIKKRKPKFRFRTFLDRCLNRAVSRSLLTINFPPKNRKFARLCTDRQKSQRGEQHSPMLMMMHHLLMHHCLLMSKPLRISLITIHERWIRGNILFMVRRWRWIVVCHGLITKQREGMAPLQARFIYV